MTTEVMLYRKTNPDGTSKDWAVPTCMVGLMRFYFGRTGSTLRLTERPRLYGRLHPQQQLEPHIQKKLSAGYRLLGIFQLADNRRDLTPVTDTAAATSVATASTADDVVSVPIPSLYWGWSTRAKEVEASARNTACVEILQHLAAVGWGLPHCPSDAEGPAIWSAVTKDASHGIVPLAEDCKSLVAFFIYLAQRGPLSVANEQGQIITTWPSELPVDAQILETLGLRPKDPNRLLTALPGGEWFY